jgi:DNA-binding response OmpR family regulator
MPHDGAQQMVDSTPIRTTLSGHTPRNVADNLKFNANGYGISIDGTPIALTYKEFELFSMLVKSPGKVISREEILQKIWSEGGKEGSRVIDVHIRRIRSKLGPTYARKIQTIRSVGYTYRS